MASALWCAVACSDQVAKMTYYEENNYVITPSIFLIYFCAKSSSPMV